LSGIFDNLHVTVSSPDDAVQTSLSFNVGSCRTTVSTISSSATPAPQDVNKLSELIKAAG